MPSPSPVLDALVNTRGKIELTRRAAVFCMKGFQPKAKGYLGFIAANLGRSSQLPKTIGIWAEF